MMERKFGSSQQYDKKSYIQRKKEDSKQFIYQVMYYLLKEDEGQIYIYFFLVFVQFLQVLYIPFHEQVKSSWKQSEIVDPISDVLGYLNFTKYFGEDQYNTFIIVFYVMIGLIVFLLLDIFFVNYQIQRKKTNSLAWPLQILKLMFVLYSTILFQPTVNMLLFVYMCDFSTGYHLVFKQEKCFGGINVIHAVVGIIVLVVFILLCMQIQLLYFEYKKKPNDPLSKKNGYHDYFFQLFQIYSALIVVLLNSNGLSDLFSILMVVSGVFIFVKFHDNPPFYVRSVGKVWQIFTSIILWTQIMFCFANFLENEILEGSIYAWMIGIPILVLLEIINSKNFSQVLMMNETEFQPESLLQQIHLIQELSQSNSKESQIILDGFLENHAQNCSYPNCAAKKNKAKKGKEDELHENLMIQKGNMDNHSEKYGVVKQLVPQLFLKGLKQYPGNIQLRLQYGFFLLEDRKFQQTAIQEFQYAEQNNPNFHEEFVIYRYKKLIEDDISETQGVSQQGNFDMNQELSFQVQMKSLQNNIERCSLIHMEFWAQLNEENPDLRKLNDIGSKVYQAIQQVEDTWNKLKKLNIKSHKPYILYAKYLSEVINDKNEYKKLMDLARSIQNQNQKSRKVTMFTSFDEITTEPNPTLIITTEKERFAQVVAMNQASANLFNYMKQDLLGRRINLLMPEVYSSVHDEILKTVPKRHGKDEKFSDKEKVIYGKNKSNYIFPLFLQIQPMITNSVAQGLQFFGVFRQEKNFRRICYVLADMNGNIYEISSSAINFLNIDNKSLKEKVCNIEDLVPEIMSHKEKYMNKQGDLIQVNSLTETYVDKENLNVFELNLTIQKIHINMIGLRDQGLVFKFEEPSKLQPSDNNMTQMVSQRDVDNSLSNGNNNNNLTVDGLKAKKCNYHFTFYPMEATVKGQYTPIGTKPLNVQLTQVTNNNNNVSTSTGDQSNQQGDILGSQEQVKTSKTNSNMNNQLGITANQLILPKLGDGNVNVSTMAVNSSRIASDRQQINGKQSKRSKLKTIQEEKMAAEMEKDRLKSKMRYKDPSEIVANWAKGIRTHRLLDNRIHDINDINNTESDEEDQNNAGTIFDFNSTAQDEQDDSLYDLKDPQKCRAILNSVVNDTSETVGIIVMRWVSFLILICLIVLTIVEYFITNNGYNVKVDVIKTIQLCNLRVTQFGVIQRKSADLYQLGEGMFDSILDNSYDSSSGITVDQYVESLTQFYYNSVNGDITYALDLINEAEDQIPEAKFTISEEHNKLLNEKQITIYFSDSDAELYSLSDAIQQMKTYSQQISGKALSEIVQSDSSIYFIEKNMFNDFFEGLMKNNSYYIELLGDLVKDSKLALLIILIVSFVFVFFVIIITYPMLRNVNKSREDVLRLFLDIPEKTVAQLYRKCETFISNLQQGEDEEVESQEEKDDKHDLDQIFRNRRRKKRFNKFKLDVKPFFVVFVCGFIVIEAYFVQSYINNRSLLSKIESVIQELNATVMTEANIFQYDNSIRQLLYNNETELFNQNAYEYTKDITTILFGSDAKLHEYHAKNYGILESYDKAFEEILMGNPCPTLEGMGIDEDISQCNTIADGTVKQGLALTITRIIENIRNMLTLFEIFKNNPSVDGSLYLTDITDIYDAPSGATANEIAYWNFRKNSASILVNDEGWESRNLKSPYMNYLFKYLAEKFLESIKEMLNNSQVQRIGTLIAVNVLMVITFVLLWLPYLSKLTKNTWKTRMMLAMVPVDIITKITSIKRFIKMYVKQNQKQKP